MAKVLYLTHRLPYPPDKGDKIATFNFLKQLSAHHEVYLGAFVDDPADWQHLGYLKSFCADLKLVGINPLTQRLLSARSLLMGRSISELYHHSGALQRWVVDTARTHGIEHGLTYCSAMAPYLVHPQLASMRKVAHFSDVDSEKWRSYATTQSGPMSWVYAREARTLLALERQMSKAYDITSFVSDADAELYRQLAPESAAKVRVIPNGVDTDYFSPDLTFESPFDASAKAIVFTGAMDYWPNADAVKWFAESVFGLVRQRMPQAQFWIVGSKPGAEVKELARIEGVHVTGRVPDVRPYLAHANAVVAPLRVARGTQNKVLEAFAMGRRVVMTAAAANGLQPAEFIIRHTHDEPGAMAQSVLEAMQTTPEFDEARQYAVQRYSWSYAYELMAEALSISAKQTQQVA